MFICFNPIVISKLPTKALNHLHDALYLKPSMIGKEVDVTLGTHSMRKTRDYHLYQNTKDIARVMKMLRHSSEGVTLRYIGITQDDVDKYFVDLEI